MTWLLIALAGGLGSVCRYLVDHVVTADHDGHLPWGTLAVNVSGSFALGLIGGFAARTTASPELILVVGGGFLGAYTTFSTAMFETLRLWHDGHRRSAAANLLAPLILAVASAALGWWLVS